MNATRAQEAVSAPTPRPVGTSLRARMRLYALGGIVVVGGWLYFTVQAVVGLYETTVEIARYTELRARVSDAAAALQEANDSLERYTRDGEGFDLSQHYSGRTTIKASLRAIQDHPLTEGMLGAYRRADGADSVYEQAADSAIAARAGKAPGESLAVRDNRAAPAEARLSEALTELERTFASSQGIAEQQLRSRRDAATTALVLLAALIVGGLMWLLADVNQRILEPCASAARALGDLVGGRPVARLPDARHDELGDLGRNFNEASRLFDERARALASRDIESSVNAVLAAAATINDLEGFRTRLLDKVLEVTGASSAVLYLPDGAGGFRPAASLGGASGSGEASHEETSRAAREGRPIYVSVDARTPTVDLFDGRILPRESVHLPLMYFGDAVGVLALGAVAPFTPRARNTLAAIAPSLAVALANASANERVAEQSRRLAEQNELLEEQRSRIARTAQELQRASELKDRFLAAVSHELRTPMTVILGFTGTLLRGTQGELTPQQRESLERVQRNARLLLALINDVLDISKIEAGKAEVRLEPVVAAALLRQVEADFGDAARRKGLELTTAADPALEGVRSDPAKLTQILANLVGNALKFTEKGSVSVRAEPRGPDGWALVVADTGIGIPPSEQQTIFEEFRQGESPAHRSRGGTGLGLAIVRKLASLLGGEVEVRSAPGKGSAFIVTLPRRGPDLSGEAAQHAEPVAARQLSDRPAPSGPATPQPRVLVVDDDESTRRLIELELAPRGVGVLHAENGAQALEIARRELPAAIILDVLMPGVGGWATLQSLKESRETRAIPVLIHSVLDNRTTGFSLGAFDCLVKPVAPGRLFEVLSRAGVLGYPGYVLVVDDDPDILRLLDRELAAAGFRAVTASGGEQALAQLERETPSAVLLDLVMPPPDGFEVLYRIRELPHLRDVPIVVMTGKDLSDSDYARINGSAERILHKGGDATALVSRVLDAIGGTEPVAASAG
jgi:signal transduction histidine kinase/DNA-binding response OmpR family regulator